MKHIFSLNKFVLGFALLSWIIPFVISGFFVNPETKELLINPLFFHGGLIIIFILLILFFYKKLQAKELLSLEAAHTFVTTNIILDIVILYGLLQVVTLSDWLMMIAPVYFIVAYGMYFFLKK